jgi:hypothetical protein
MKAFRISLVIAFSTLFLYTVLVGYHQGWNLIPVFFKDILSISWAGQFNLDFSFYLLLSSLWIAWRHRFSGKGFFWASLAVIGGMLVLSMYLLITSFYVKNWGELLIGQQNTNES